MMTTSDACPPMADRITKSLSGYGVIAGPVYVLSVVIQALTRAGFDPLRHEASLLANGDRGWIQIVTFVLAGAMTIAAAVGMGRALDTGRTAKWAAVLVAGYGAGLAGAGVFRADPSMGFPGLTGALFAGGFAAIASGSGSPIVVLFFTAAVVIAWAWLTAISVKLYRGV